MTSSTHSERRRLRDSLGYAFLSRFWLLVVSLTALVGTYLGFDAVDRTTLFWVIVGLAAALAVGWVGGPRLYAAWQKLRSFPRMLERVALLEEQVEERDRVIASLSSRASDQEKRAIIEGRRQVEGALLAQRAVDVPAISLVTAGEDGALSIIANAASPESIAVGARFELQIEATEQRLGVLEVVLVDPERSFIHMRCVERIAAEFWQRLEQRSSAEFEPPSGVCLKRTNHELLTGQAATPVASLQTEKRRGAA
jgi:hypothetical protein